MKHFIRLTALILLIIAVGYMFIPKPELVNYQSYSRAFLAKDGSLLRLTLANDQRYRLYVEVENVASVLKEATLLYEDQDFYQHPGVDPVALVRAFWRTYVTKSRRVGGSTISMQVARLRWNLNSRTLSGKLTQILRALQITRHYSKDDVFEAYLNLASYGRNIEGIEAASLIYFNKSAADLSLPEAMSLCVVPQNPVKRNPTTTAGFGHLKEARDALFERWVESHPEDERQRLYFELPLNVRSPEGLPFAAPHFVNALDQELPALTSGRIETTLNNDVQNLVDDQLQGYIDKHSDLGLKNGAVAVLNYQTMELEAVTGSVDFWNSHIQGQVNGTTAKRSPGSTLKPFVYALAIDQGLIHPLTILKDSPQTYAGFTPENYDQKFLGPISAQDALILSRNVPAVNLQSRLSSPSFYQWLVDADIAGLQSEGHYGLSLALGGAELTMLELLRLYATLPNGGVLKTIRSLHEMEAAEDVSVLSPESAYLTLEMLSRNPAPDSPVLTGQVGAGLEVAWKTGTSFAYRDAWAIGVSGPYVIAVWIGNFDGAGNPEFIGRKAAGPLLFELFRALKGSDDWSATESLNPEMLNLKKVAVCSASGDLPNTYCPQTTETWFIPGVSPIKVSTLHRAVYIDPVSGLRACYQQPGVTEMQVYEFWPTDLSRIFRQAGISIKQPPAYQSNCDIDDLSQAGNAPLINSPRWGVQYSLRSDIQDDELIPFSAIVDVGVKEVFWFVDDKFVGKVNAGNSLFWHPQSGHFTVRVVDDQGRAAQRQIDIAFVRESHAKDQ
jgi:penicillin-binding protein 1C